VQKKKKLQESKHKLDDGAAQKEVSKSEDKEVAVPTNGNQEGK
jgi:hypothetical protein